MENLNDLIWMDEDDNKGNSTQHRQNPPMKDFCLVCLCKFDSGEAAGGCSGWDPSEGLTNLLGCIV